jgi:hypothetical protein
VNHKKEKCQESSFSLDIIVKKKKLPALSKKHFKEPKKKKKKTLHKIGQSVDCTMLEENSPRR